MKAWKGLLKERLPSTPQNHPQASRDTSKSSIEPTESYTLPVFEIPELGLPTWKFPENKQESPKSPEPIVVVPPDPKPIESRLPLEIWKDIFIFASMPPARDEFSVDGSAYHVMPCDLPAIPAPSTHKDYTDSIQTRLRIIQVCKHWYSSGIRVLWSHLRIDLCGKESAMESMHRQLYVAPTLAAYVIRLDVTFPAGRFPSLYKEFEKILGHLPSLKIINCPLPFGLSMYHCRPDVVILQRGFPMTIGGSAGADFWRSTRIMHIDCGTQSLIKHPMRSVEFLRLEDLRIKDESGNMTAYVLEHWNVPSLRILSIEGSGFTALNLYTTFLGRNGRRLEKLEINTTTFPFDTVSLPALTTLYVAYRGLAWLSMIKSPHLYRFGIFDIPLYFEDQCAERVDGLTMVKEISFRGIGVGELYRNNLKWTTNTGRWRERGILVDFH